MREAVARHFPAATRVTRPRGGHVLWVELPRGVDSVALFEAAAEAGVSLAPGPMFDVNGGYRNCIRLHTGGPWSPRVDAALATIGRLARERITG
jgi:DNA-binding transcriptional MocR family regulator